ncbi:MAG: DoxX family membrane protein [Deltaproteobacteria bacterium]|nr:DoxX family membrane protein [Deltaproteobacteria bacterium]MBW2305758.1 DoxX family membrane protein [Deltaproteobacteria bacterium]
MGFIDSFKRKRSFKQVIFLFRLFLGALFIYASIHKILEPGDFAVSIRNYQLLPSLLSNLAAICLPWVELVCGVFLVAGVFVRSSAAVVSALLAVFASALIISLARGLDIECGCFQSGRRGEGVTALYILRDMALLLISLSVMIFEDGFLVLIRD